MKRGFLLGKKAVAKRRDAKKSTEFSTVAVLTPAGLQHPKGSDYVEQGKSADDNQTEEATTHPNGYDLTNCKLLYDLEDSDPRVIGFNEDVVAITTIPQSVLDGETQSVWIVTGSTIPKVRNASGYPAQIPNPRLPDLYEIRSTLDMGKGVFAKRDIVRGEIIFSERPLLVVPDNIQQLRQGDSLGDWQQRKQITLSEFESLLEAAVVRLSPENQADYRALQNNYTRDKCGPLLGIVRTNNYGLNNLYDGSDMSANYDVVGKIASRINHSCIPNVKFYFKLDSFSIQFYALNDIKAGDQLFYSYCLVNGSLAQRQANLVQFGVVCKCPGCVDATPETDKLRTKIDLSIQFFQEKLSNHSDPYLDIWLTGSLKLEELLLKEGLNAHCGYLVLLMAISAAYLKLGEAEKSRKYDDLLDKFRKYAEEEWKGIQIT